MNVLVDTNVLISARLYGGKPQKIFRLVLKDRTIHGYTSNWLINEQLHVLSRKFNYDTIALRRVEMRLRRYFTVVNPLVIPTVITNDPDDNQVLAITHEAKIDYIISGDKHLLELREYNSTPIVTPDTFLDNYNHEK